jgi:hypothetical protein
LAISDINQAIIERVTSGLSRGVIVNAIGYLLLALVVIGLLGGVAWWYINKKKFDRKVTAHGIIHGYFYPVFKDIAKSVKLGKGGFEILYLKKLKTWKLAHGARGGIKDYHFYILQDGYWYPGQVSADLKQIDKNKGLITVMTTNPTMRAQYTALEKQIDALHGEKRGFWDKYGQWIVTGTFIALMGIFAWLSFREISQFLGAGSALADRMNELAETMARLATNLNSAQPSGLVPAT